MKKIITLTLSSIFALTTFAQYNQNASTVTVMFGNKNGKGNAGNNDFQVVIDGRNYSNTTGNYSQSNRGRDDRDRRDNKGNQQNGNEIVLNNLQVGQHTIQVLRSKNNNGRNGGNNQTVYNSTFLVKQGYNVDLLVKPNGQVQYTETQVNNRGRNQNQNNNNGKGYGKGSNNNGRHDNDREGDDDHKNGKHNGGYNNGTGNGGYNNGNNDGNNNGGYNNNYPGQNNRTPMNDADFNNVLQSVKSRWLQSSKVTGVRDAFNSSNYYSVNQVHQLLEVVSSESNRLELAKLSYNKISDPANFRQLYDLFSTQASRDELDNYTRNNRY